MNRKPEIICVGSIVWDIIGRSQIKMPIGADRPGKIIKIPGGVGLNLAMKLSKNGFAVAMVGMIGKDTEGQQLIKEITMRGIITSYISHSETLPTDCYMAIEGSNGLIGAIADSTTLESCEDSILSSLKSAISVSEEKPWTGIVALDGNLSNNLLSQINSKSIFKFLDLRIAPASPGKAERLKYCLNGNISSIYVNLEEANIILDQKHSSSEDAASALTTQGLPRAIVTNGAESVAVSANNELISINPPTVEVSRVTGAGDIFMASHIQAEMTGKENEDAIKFALEQTAKYISSSEAL